MKRSTSKSVTKTRILVVDDHPLFRHGLVDFIDRQRDLTCCGEADSGVATQKAVATLKPDLLLLDLRLASGDGLELIKSLKAQFPKLPILVLSQLDEALYAERALRAGARGYLMKEAATNEVLTAIRAVVEGELYVSRKVSVLVLHKLLESAREMRRSGIETLSDRELQVFQMLGAGISTREMAAELKLSFKTIETYREHIKHKLGLDSAPQLIRCATEWVQGAALSPSPPAKNISAGPRS